MNNSSLNNKWMILSVFMLIGVFLNAQVLKGVIKGEKASELEGKSITVVVSSDEAKEAFENALAECWSFTNIEEIIVNPDHKSKTEESGKYYMKLREMNSESMPSYNHSLSLSDRHGFDHAAASNNNVKTDVITKYTWVSTAYELIISTGGAKTSLAEVLIPLDELEDLTDDMIYFGLSTLQEQLDYLIASGAKNSMGFISDKYKNNDPSLKDKNVLILANQVQVGKKETMEDVLKSYTASEITAVQFDEWSDAILSKKEGYAYLVVVPLPVGGSYALRFNIVDCASGNLLAACQQTGAGIKGGKVKVDVSAKILEKLGK